MGQARSGKQMRQPRWGKPDQASGKPKQASQIRLAMLGKPYQASHIKQAISNVLYLRPVCGVVGGSSQIKLLLTQLIQVLLLVFKLKPGSVISTPVSAALDNTNK